MVRNSEKRESNAKIPVNETRIELAKDLDKLFVLPLAGFTAGRNALAAKLKREGLVEEAGRVKALAKPSISAWTVNQLYWQHPEAFNRLLEAGEQVRQSQVSLMAGKITATRDSFDARRAALADLLRLAASILREAGQNPAPDKMSRISTTLEAISVLASLPNAPDAGHLTDDVDPPGFDVLANLIPNAGVTKRNDALPLLPPIQTSDNKPVEKHKVASDNSRKAEEARQAKVAAAKILLRESQRGLEKSRAETRSAEAGLKRAEEKAQEAERRLREAKQHFDEARAALEEASAAVKQAEKTESDAERTVEKAAKELQSLL